jgi:hypothetical protein
MAMRRVSTQLEGTTKSRLKSKRGFILVALATGYTGLLAVTNADQAWHKGGTLGAIFIVMVVLLAAVSIYGLIVLLRMIILFWREK